MSRAGLKKVSKSVKGKHGPIVRSYWVKASPKLEARKGNRTMTAGEYVKTHALHVAGRNVAHGAVSMLGAEMGGHLGNKIGQRVGSRKGYSAAYIAGHFGENVGRLVGGLYTSHQLNKVVYRDKRGQQALYDLQRSTLGAKLTHVGVSMAANFGAQYATHKAYTRARYR